MTPRGTQTLISNLLLVGGWKSEITLKTLQQSLPKMQLRTLFLKAYRLLTPPGLQTIEKPLSCRRRAVGRPFTHEGKRVSDVSVSRKLAKRTLLKLALGTLFPGGLFSSALILQVCFAQETFPWSQESWSQSRLLPTDAQPSAP